MSDAPAEPTEAEQQLAEHAEIVLAGGNDDDGGGESISSPAKVMRIGAMIKQLLEEVRSASLDVPGRDRLKAIYEESIEQLAETMSPDLRDELARLAPPFADDTPTEPELRVAQAQLVGWLEGLFHGIQATLFAQQMAARQQLEQQMRGIGPGQRPDGPPEARPGTYL